MTKRKNTINKYINILCLFLAVLALFTCSDRKSEIILFPESNFQKTIGDQDVRLFTLKNKNGLVCQITNYGGRVVSLRTPASLLNY
ncbi:hypothetical protein [Seonamhaeicola sp.]|uniref:hypothetical protein n=1 Tax=Seonamhaeicola sp. TaxID=1912245 RepID=UPI0026127747|nr:hypothetical protein [Seonamhaeicola sp.]